MSEIELQSLAPKYRGSDHSTYVHHLDKAVENAKNRNIALTGRYGAGKSSILDNFLEQQSTRGRRTLRISINTLGPADDEDITNRIQKELVKQLVYRAEPGVVRRSRFARHRELSRWRASRDALGITIVVVGLLWLFGVRPVANALGTADPTIPAIVFALLVFAAAFAARWIIGDRLVSQVSTGGTSIEFEKRPDSYFDEYLDEIVAFFDATEPDIVVFEDLDRFDDVRIFDSLRELNTLINASAHWAARSDRPIRFVYAIKDSLFEKLGGDPEDKDNQSASNRIDPVASEIERANRTKFFEIVVPVVPFLSHSNARDLFGSVLTELKLPDDTIISRPLLDLAARHVTDMRLMKNIANEFVVYAEKLLWPEHRAPGITADALFALIVYKNFHLSDFEALPHRESALDTLESLRRNLVQEGVDQLQTERRDLVLTEASTTRQPELAEILGERLLTFVTGTNHTITTIQAGTESFDEPSLRQPALWKSVSDSGELRVTLGHMSGYTAELVFDRAKLELIFPEGANASRWATPDEDSVAQKRAELDARVATLRGSDFSDLTKDSRYEVDGSTFGGHVESALRSELARDLVRRGFITRYYAEYSSIFYGDYLGVDVANFFRNSIWPNAMDVQFVFTTPTAIPNLLAQAPSGFTRTRSALNIQIVNYLLENDLVAAREIVEFLVTEPSADSATFLDAFLNADGSPSDELIGLLAEFPWRGLFDFLARQESTPDPATRARLLNTALLHAQDASKYTLGGSARSLIADLHSTLPAYHDEQPVVAQRVLMSFLAHASFTVPQLRPLAASLRRRVIEARQYDLTAANLRVALELDDDTAISLEHIVTDEAVWLHVAQDPIGYIDLVEQDAPTQYAVTSAHTLHQIVSSQHEIWSEQEFHELLAASAPESALQDITTVPNDLWRVIAAARRMAPTTANLHAYTAALGIDSALTTVLVDDEQHTVEIGGIEDTDPAIVHELTVVILNTSELNTGQRVALVTQFRDRHGPLSFDVSEIQPEPNDLLAELLEAGLVPDTANTFTHFSSAGWEAISDAFVVSADAATFISPALLGTHSAELLANGSVPFGLKHRIVSELETFATTGGPDLLRTAAAEAATLGVHLTLAQLELVAPHVSSAEHVLRPLAEMGDGFDPVIATRVVGFLGGLYLRFHEGPGYPFEVPASNSMRTLLSRLEDANAVEILAAERDGWMALTLK